MVLVPTAKITPMENSTLVKGTARFTAAMAYSPTPFATISPSTIEYRLNTISDATVAATKCRNCDNRLRSLSIFDKFPFLIQSPLTVRVARHGRRASSVVSILTKFSPKVKSTSR